MDNSYINLIQQLRAEDQGRPDVAAMVKQLETAGMDNLHPALTGWIDETDFGTMVKHPFVYTFLGPEGLLVDNANQFYAQKRAFRRRYLDEGNWNGYLYSHERPWRMHALEKLWRRKRITVEQLRELLASMWIDTEAPQSNQAEPLHLFREAGFTTDDPQGWAKLAKQKAMVLYRGVDYSFELTMDGPSWTRSKKTAEFFAYRFGKQGDVFKYVAKPDEALAWMSGRGETEVILDFARTSDASRIVKL